MDTNGGSRPDYQSLFGEGAWALDGFNDLLLAYLDDHAPIKTVKIRHKPNPFIMEEIRDLMKMRDHLHKRVRKTGMRKIGRFLRSCEIEINLFYGGQNESTTVSKSVKIIACVTGVRRGGKGENTSARRSFTCMLYIVILYVE